MAEETLKLLLGAAGAALVGLLVLRSWRLGPARVLRTLASGPAWDEPPVGRLSAGDSVLWWLAHAGGLSYLWRLSGRSYPLAVPLGLASAALLLLPQWRALLRHKCPDVAVLTPLALPYAAGLLYGLHLLPAAPGAALLGACELAAVGYVLLVQVERARGVPKRPGAAHLLLAAVALWCLAEYVGGRTHGVTGSDPFCYAQMAVDLARHGDPRHTFSLMPQVRDLGIPWWPLAHVGYHVPDAATGLAATVWPVGWPALLAAGYRLLGEPGLYLGAPIAGLLSLVATGGLAWALWPEGRPRERELGVALALLILGTSREQVLQLLVPMADVPTQLFTVLAMWLALRARQRGLWALAGLAGVALGVAYDMRHTQVFLAPALALALWPAGGPAEPRRPQMGPAVAQSPFASFAVHSASRWARLVGAAALGAWLAAAPDLWYHRVAFGSIWRPESPELCLISLRHWWGNAGRMAVAAASRPEFGLLLPFLLYGGWRLWRDRRRGALLLAAWLVLGAGLQFLYGPLRWRDLLSVLPALAILTAYGSVGLLRRLGEVRWPGPWLMGWAALALAMLLTWRSGTVLTWPRLEAEMTFGFMTASQRQAFDRLGGLVEPEAVIGSALNSGAIELYTGRQTFRPGDWSVTELEAFLAAMAGAGKPAYIVDDGNEQARVVERLRHEGRLLPVEALNVPLYGERGHLTGMLYRVR